MRTPSAPAVLAVLALGCAPAAAHAATPAKVVAALNAQRAAHGIPAGIVEDPELSAKCAKHVAWMTRNDTFSHEEQPGTPGYSEDGHFAGTNSILAAGSVDWSRPSRNPYLTAPYHLMQALHPRLASMGANENGRFGCHTTFPGYTRKAPPLDTFYSYPGNRRTTPWFETARELPSVPGDAVGLPEGTTTGPNIEVFWDGPLSEVGSSGYACIDVCPSPMRNLVAATLADGRGRAAAVRTVGNQQNGGVLRGAGFVIPEKPLRPGSTYFATATFSSADEQARTFTGSWTFVTTKLPSARKAVKIVATKRSRSLEVTTTATDVYAGRAAKMTLSYGRFKFTRSMTLGASTLTGPAIPRGGRVVILVTVKSFKVGSVRVPGFTLVRVVKG